MNNANYYEREEITGHVIRANYVYSKSLGLKPLYKELHKPQYKRLYQ